MMGLRRGGTDRVDEADALCAELIAGNWDVGSGSSSSCGEELRLNEGTVETEGYAEALGVSGEETGFETGV